MDFWPIVRTIKDYKELKNKVVRSKVPVSIYTQRKGKTAFIGLIELNKKLSGIGLSKKLDNIEFSQPDKKRTHSIAGVGAIAAGGANVWSGAMLAGGKRAPYTKNPTISPTKLGRHQLRAGMGIAAAGMYLQHRRNRKLRREGYKPTSTLMSTRK